MPSPLTPDELARAVAAGQAFAAPFDPERAVGALVLGTCLACHQAAPVDAACRCGSWLRARERAAA